MTDQIDMADDLAMFVGEVLTDEPETDNMLPYQAVDIMEKKLRSLSPETRRRLIAVLERDTNMLYTEKLLSLKGLTKEERELLISILERDPLYSEIVLESKIGLSKEERKRLKASVKKIKKGLLNI